MTFKVLKDYQNLQLNFQRFILRDFKGFEMTLYYEILNYLCF